MTSTIRFKLLVGIATCIAGCGDRQNKIASGEIPVGAPLEAPRVLIEQPKAGAVLKPDEPFECVVSLRTTGQARPPETIIVSLRDGAVNLDSRVVGLEPTDDRGGTGEIGIHKYKNTYRAPKRRGRYSVHAQAIVTRVTPPAADGEEPKVDSVKSDEARVEIEVH